MELGEAGCLRIDSHDASAASGENVHAEIQHLSGSLQYASLPLQPHGSVRFVALPAGLRLDVTDGAFELIPSRSGYALTVRRGFIHVTLPGREKTELQAPMSIQIAVLRERARIGKFCGAALPIVLPFESTGKST